LAAARLAAALSHIAESFIEPELTLAAVARRQGVSPRYLQRLLEASGRSCIAHVSELRLQRAFALLTKALARRSARPATLPPAGKISRTMQRCPLRLKSGDALES
jgi:AraC-like DNA-binding protein